jgi:hypothetical protein
LLFSQSIAQLQKARTGAGSVYIAPVHEKSHKIYLTDCENARAGGEYIRRIEINNEMAAISGGPIEA